MSVRIDASADQIRRTASLPARSAATFCGWFSALTPQDTQIDDYLLIFDSVSGDYVIFSHDTTSVGGVNAHALTCNGPWNHFGSTPAANTPFWAALTLNNGTVTAYRRVRGENALTSPATLTYPTSGSWSGFEIGCNSTNSSEFGDCAVWNVKCWDRVLTPTELLIESYYRNVKFPASLNFYFPLDRHDNLNDYSGNARHATSAGTLTTENHSEGLWRPRRRIFLSAGVAAPGQSDLGMMPWRRIHVVD